LGEFHYVPMMFHEGRQVKKAQIRLTETGPTDQLSGFATNKTRRKIAKAIQFWGIHNECSSLSRRSTCGQTPVAADVAGQ
jgi:hypothetical protein